MITWSIKDLVSDETTGGVIKACTLISWTGDGLQDSQYEWVHFFPDPTAPSFIPFTELTETVVLNWVFEKMGAEWKAQKEYTFKKNLGLVQPIIENTQIPWK